MAMFEPFRSQPFTEAELWDRLLEVATNEAIFPEEDHGDLARWLQVQQIKIQVLRDMGLWSDAPTDTSDTFPWSPASERGRP